MGVEAVVFLMHAEKCLGNIPNIQGTKGEHSMPATDSLLACVLEKQCATRRKWVLLKCSSPVSQSIRSNCL